MHTHLDPSDITKVQTGVILHGCNAQRVMGSGVAKQLRAKYPEVYFDYVEAFNSFKIMNMNPLGQIVHTKVGKDLYVISGITQEFYGRDGRQYVDYSALDRCIASSVAYAQKKDLPLHIPYLIGAGLGGGSEKIILDTFAKYQYNIIFHHWK